MAMIDVDLGEFVEQAIVAKSKRTKLDEGKLALAREHLLAVANRAVDVAIMRAVLHYAADGFIKKRQVDALHDLMRSGDKAHTEKHLRTILTDLDDVIGAELFKLREMYLLGK